MNNPYYTFDPARLCQSCVAKFPGYEWMATA